MKDEVLLQRSKIIVQTLKNYDSWISLDKLVELTGLKKGQIEAAVKYERRWFLEHPEKCGNTYILSGKYGYKLPVSDQDYVPVYKSLYAWGISVLTTISPIGKYLADKGFDVKAIRKEIYEKAGLNDEIGGPEAWFD